jgi:hypothetical protein
MTMLSLPLSWPDVVRAHVSHSAMIGLHPAPKLRCLQAADHEEATVCTGFKVEAVKLGSVPK